MQRNFLQLAQSIWWVPLILLTAALVTWWLYSQRKKPWNAQQNLLLSILRFLAISLTLFLLLEPLIRQVVSRVEQPIVAIAVDDSQSVIARGLSPTQLRQEIGAVSKELGEEGFEVRTFYLGEKTDSIGFSQNSTNLSALLRKVDDDMEGRNWATTLLITDGIFNQGSSPLYRPYRAPQFTIGLGDTIPPKDINISRVKYNKITYKGNDTPIRIEVSQRGFEGRKVKISLREGANVLGEQQLVLTKSLEEVEFTIKSDKEGLRRLNVSLPFQEGEFVRENNRSDLFMEVIDGKQKVLIIANAPHPDIKAIRSTLATSDNYQTDIFIPSLDQERPNEVYDVVIYHGAFSNRINFEPKENPGIWYILNRNSSLARVNQAINFASIRRQGAQPDKVTGAFNQAFSKFKLPEDSRLIETFPPLEVPFGDYTIGANSEVLLYQRVGNVVTKKPLFTFFDDGAQKKALLVGQDFWKWKFQETAINGISTQFNELISKTIQFLSVKNDKKQFRFQSRASRFSSIESPIFDSEVYNDIYERVYGNTLSLRVNPEQGNGTEYEFIDSEFKSSFKIPPLPSGLYNYQASTVVGDKKLTDKGQFLIEEINKEYLNLAADHDLLKNIAEKTNGEYLHYSQFNQIKDRIVKRVFKSVVTSSDSFFPLIENKWVLFIILILFSLEWLLRK
ncbi:MAG: hypothetical protein AAGA66_12405, partial [Bacteroidota bacterium]